MCTVSMTMEETLILFGRRQTRFPAKASRQAVLVWRKFVHAGAQTFGTPQEAGWSSSTAQLQYVPRDEADAVVTSNHVQVERAIGQSINQSINQSGQSCRRLPPHPLPQPQPVGYGSAGLPLGFQVLQRWEWYTTRQVSWEAIRGLGWAREGKSCKNYCYTSSE